MTVGLSNWAYDWYVTGGRWETESAALELGVTVGMLSDYLTGSLEVDYYTGDLQSLYMDGVAEGIADQRFEHTAEELFIWAHEFDGEHL